MDIYSLYRNFWDWCFENPEKIKPNHIALYSFSIEHCNRLGWKEKFGLPTTMAKEAIGIKSYTTYIKTLNELVEWGFILILERSKNQYSANIIALTNFDKASVKALDKALIKHVSKQVESTCESIVSIDKQIYNNTNIPINNNDVNFEVYKNQIAEEGNTVWLEGIYMTYKLKPKTFSFVVDDFILHLKCQDATKHPKNLKDFKRYLYNWCNRIEPEGKLNKYKKNQPKQVGQL